MATVQPREVGAGRGPSAPEAHQPLVVIVAETVQERLALAESLPVTSPVLLARDITQARQALAQLPGTTPSRRTGAGTAGTGPQQLPVGRRPGPEGPPAPSGPESGGAARPVRALEPVPAVDGLDRGGGREAPLQLREDRLSLTLPGREVSLTPLEFALLQHLLPRMGEVATFEQLSQVGWRTPYLGNGAHIHAAVGRVRTKLTDLGVPLTIEAVRGLGFRLVGHGSATAAQEAAHR